MKIINMPDKEVEFRKALFNAQTFCQQQLNYSYTNEQLTVISCQRARTVVMFIFDATGAEANCELYCFMRTCPTSKHLCLDDSALQKHDLMEAAAGKGLYRGNYYLYKTLLLAELYSCAAVTKLVDGFINECKSSLHSTLCS